jgi:hypothetical protein
MKGNAKRKPNTREIAFSRLFISDVSRKVKKGSEE